MWRDRVQSVYNSLDELKSYDELYGVVNRCGYETAEELWEKNPDIQGSSNPSDFGLAFLPEVEFSYCEAIHFTEDHSEDTDGDISNLDFSEDSLKTVHNVCQKALKFLYEKFPTFELTQKTCELFGHDLWLTRNGHGAGFWDGDWDENIGDVMTKYCQTLHENYVYGDNGTIRFEWDK